MIDIKECNLQKMTTKTSKWTKPQFLFDVKLLKFYPIVARYSVRTDKKKKDYDGLGKEKKKHY